MPFVFGYKVPDGSFFLPQTREQLQVELNSCLAKIVDLEKALAERGQVIKTVDGDRSSLVLLSLLVLLHVCLAAVLLGWRFAEQVCRRILWCHYLHVWCQLCACMVSFTCCFYCWWCFILNIWVCWPKMRHFNHLISAAYRLIHKILML